MALYQYCVMKETDAGILYKSGSIAMEAPVATNEEYVWLCEEISKYAQMENFIVISLNRLDG